MIRGLRISTLVAALVVGAGVSLFALSFSLKLGASLGLGLIAAGVVYEFFRRRAGRNRARS